MLGLVLVPSARTLTIRSFQAAADWTLVSALPKVLAHADGVVAAPGSVRAKISRTEITVARAEALKEKVLGHAKLETTSQENAGTPGALPADRVGRPGVESLGHILAKKETRLAEKEKTPQLGASEGTNLHVGRKHIAGEGVAGSIRSAVIFGIGSAEVGVNLVMWRREVELAISPERVAGKKHPVLASVRPDRALLRHGNS